MNFLNADIPDILIIEPVVYQDSRGFFMETFQKRTFAEAGIHADFVQDNLSGSFKGVLRGLHYQVKQAQGKLIQVGFGEIFDVAVDIRRSSNTFGRWVGVKLSAENKKIVWIPPGFAHGFLTLSDWAEVRYKVTDFYAPDGERTILWNDPQIDIDWPLESGNAPILSRKDQNGTLLSQADIFP
jgi:dTDP-4-dehydrorhamnose 3,5-epimerase